MRSNSITLQERRFGQLFVALSFSASLYSHFFSSTPYVLVFMILGVFFSGLIIKKHKLLGYLTEKWIGFGSILGSFISPVILGAMFLLLITPAAFVSRVSGRDLLKLKSSSEPSFWVQRNLRRYTLIDFKQQF